MDNGVGSDSAADYSLLHWHCSMEKKFKATGQDPEALQREKVLREVVSCLDEDIQQNRVLRNIGYRLGQLALEGGHQAESLKCQQESREETIRRYRRHLIQTVEERSEAEIEYLRQVRLQEIWSHCQQGIQTPKWPKAEKVSFLDN